MSKKHENGGLSEEGFVKASIQFMAAFLSKVEPKDMNLDDFEGYAYDAVQAAHHLDEALIQDSKGEK